MVTVKPKLQWFIGLETYPKVAYQLIDKWHLIFWTTRNKDIYIYVCDIFEKADQTLRIWEVNATLPSQQQEAYLQP